MTLHARVAVVGGGVVGTSILYHLAGLGWTDTVLLERTELTAGSTWHAAGVLPLYNPDYTMSRINLYSLELYGRLETESGQPTGFHRCGQLRLATSRDRMEEYAHYVDIADSLGIECELVSKARAQELWPLADMSDVLGALYHPGDGHIAPADLTQALARVARGLGATVHRHTEVTAIERTRSGEWHLLTSGDDVIAEHVVTASGNHARQTGRMVGLDVPSIPVLHQYLVTETVPQVRERKEAGLDEMPVLRDDRTRFYLREERDGLLLGPYDPRPSSWAVDGVPPDFGQDLLPPDMDRLEPFVEGTVARVPAFEQAGIQSVVHGPIPHTPDGLPLLGPAPGLTNYWLAEGFTAGVMTAGGAGRLLSQWIVEGEPSVDMWSVAPHRYGHYAGKHYTRLKNEETYGRHFDIHYPNLELPAARPAKTSACHDRLTRAGAVWGTAGGWERANWFAPGSAHATETLSFRRSNAFEHVAAEAKAVREAAGLLDLTSFAKFEVSGRDAASFLDHRLANRIPAADGGMALAHALSQSGRILGEFVVVRLRPDFFYLVSPAFTERQDEDLLRLSLQPGTDVSIANVSMAWGCFALAGPASREILQQIVDVSLANEDFPWFTARECEAGWATGVRALRVNYLGELGWELHHPVAYQHHLLDELERAGAPHGMRHIGFRALDALRLEKSYRAIKSDITMEETVFETGMDRFVKLDEADFVGRDAVAAARDRPPRRQLVTLWVDCAQADADPAANLPVLSAGEIVGRTTSGAFGHFVGHGIALAHVDPALAVPGTELELRILGERRTARVIPDSPHDPENVRPRQ